MLQSATVPSAATTLKQGILSHTLNKQQDHTDKYMSLLLDMCTGCHKSPGCINVREPMMPVSALHTGHESVGPLFPSSDLGQYLHSCIIRIF